MVATKCLRMFNFVNNEAVHYAINMVGRHRGSPSLGRRKVYVTGHMHLLHLSQELGRLVAEFLLDPSDHLGAYTISI